MDSLNINQRKLWPLWILPILLVVGVLALGQPRTSPGAPLDLSRQHEEVGVLRNKFGEVLLYNFRAVEPKVLYRSSGFPLNGSRIENGKSIKTPAAFEDDQIIKFLQKRHIRTIVTLGDENSFWAEKGYFDWWRKRNNHQIKIISFPVKDSQTYTTKPDGALRAASKFLEWMKVRKPSDGAVLIHCDHGKDETGVAVALYELWRNQGKVEKNMLWTQIRNRYRYSNQVISSDGEVSAFAGPPQQCSDAAKTESGFVCGVWLDKLRPDLELLAQL